MNSKRGDCCFFTGLLATVLLLSFLFIFGVPKFVIAVEYWSLCPSAPFIPIYLFLTGLLGVVCVGHSAFLWACLYRRQMLKRKSHDFCLLVWILLMAAVPVSQLIGAPYIIQIYHDGSFNTTGCDVIQNTVRPQYVIPTTLLPAANDSESYTVNPVIPSQNVSSGATHPNNQTLVTTTTTTTISATETSVTDHTQCNCHAVLLTCAYVTCLFEVTLLTLPAICLVVGTIVFRLRNKEISSA